MHRKFIRTLIVLSASLVIATASVGCIALGGGSKITNPTLGEELTSLRIAKDQGAISDEEYANAKAKLLNTSRR